jgi:hypothetical protein
MTNRLSKYVFSMTVAIILLSFVPGYTGVDSLAKEFEYYVGQVAEAKVNLEKNKDPTKKWELEIRYTDAVRKYQDFAPIFEMMSEHLSIEEKTKFAKKVEEISEAIEKKITPQLSESTRHAAS